MNLLFPKITWPDFKRMVRMGLGGALAGGLYGIVHDEITYTLCPEYFTRLKFAQFGWADFGLPPRLHVAEIGFLATCWVGFIGVWFLARLALSHRDSKDQVRQHVMGGVLLMLAGGVLGGLIGNFFQMHWLGLDAPDWDTMAAEHSITDVAAFTRVASIHNGSYLGGLAGLTAGLIATRFANKRAA